MANFKQHATKAWSAAKRGRKKVLDAQLRLRDKLTLPMRKRIAALRAKRDALIKQGKDSSKIDGEIAYWVRRRGNESVYGAAMAWLTPLDELLPRIRRVEAQEKEARKKKSGKVS